MHRHHSAHRCRLRCTVPAICGGAIRNTQRSLHFTTHLAVGTDLGSVLPSSLPRATMSSPQNATPRPIGNSHRRHNSSNRSHDSVRVLPSSMSRPVGLITAPRHHAVIGAGVIINRIAIITLLCLQLTITTGETLAVGGTVSGISWQR